jgi:uncharacterized membrane protein YccF (DUF307 family)
MLSFLGRSVWFLLVGWWLALLWGAAAYLACASVVLLPLGAAMFNRLPGVLTLKPVVEDPWTGKPAPEQPLWLRAAWFFLVGWWLGLLFFKVGYLLCLSVVGIPFGVWFLHRVPLAMTLKQRA